MNRIKSYSKKNLWFIMALFLIGIPTGIILVIKNTNNVFSDYPLIRDSDPVNTVVLRSNVFKGTTLIQTSESKKISIRAFNWEIKPNVLYYHLEVGDSISRKPFSDILYLYKMDETIIEFEVQCIE